VAAATHFLPSDPNIPEELAALGAARGSAPLLRPMASPTRSSGPPELPRAPHFQRITG